jgi:hypothetical protein
VTHRRDAESAEKSFFALSLTSRRFQLWPGMDADKAKYLNPAGYKKADSQPN